MTLIRQLILEDFDPVMNKIFFNNYRGGSSLRSKTCFDSKKSFNSKKDVFSQFLNSLEKSSFVRYSWNTL